MRSTFSLLFLLLALAVAPQAQAQVQFGVRAGLNVSDVVGDDVSDSDPRLGFHGGLTATYALTPSLFIQPEALYSQKGAGFSDDGDEFSFNIDYLDVPVLIGYSLPTATNLLVQLYAGPQVSFKLSESVRSEGIGVDLDLIRSTDLGLTVGGDVGAVRVGSRQAFGVGLRYTFGFSDIFDTSNFEGAEANVRNRVLAVSGFYRF